MTLSNVSTGGVGFVVTAIEYDPNKVLAAPAAPTLSTAGTGGTVLAGTYQVEVTLVTAQGETVASASASQATTGSTSTLTINSPSPITGATGWYAYVTQAGGSSYTRQQTPGAPTPISTNLTLTAPPTSSGAAPPTVNSSGGVAGVAVTPATFLPVISKGFKAPFDMDDEKVMSATRFTHRTKERAKIQPQGPVGWKLNPYLDSDFYQAGLGGQTTTTPIAAVATTAVATTDNGVTSYTVPGAWTLGAIVKVNVTAGGAEQAETETLQVHPSSTSGHLKVTGASPVNQAAASGIFITQPAQVKVANSLLGALYAAQLPTLTYEDNKGNWAWRQSGTYVEKLDFAFGAKGVDVTAGLYGTGGAPADLNSTTSPAMVTYAPGTTAEGRALRPFTAIDLIACVANDNDATGACAVRLADTMFDLKLSLDNKLIKIPVFNGSQSYAAWPGDDVSLKVDYSEVNTAGRPAEWEDLIATSTATPMQMLCRKNYGTKSAPVTGAIAFYLPNIRLDMADPEEKTGDVNKIKLSGESMVGAGLPNDLLQMFILAI